MADRQKLKKTDKPGADDGCICAICNQPIIDRSPTTDGEDSIFCEGMCKKWVHRTCAGLTDPVFDMLHRSGMPFKCYHCQFVSHLAEIETLRAQITNLSDELSHIKDRLNSSPPLSAVAPDPVFDVDMLRPRVAETAPAESATDETTRVPPSISPKVHRNTSSNERKFNIVAFGLPECPKGTARDTRVTLDEEKIVSMMREKISTFNALQIRDCIRIGRYVETGRNPRPILVTLGRVSDVRSILSKHFENIKPDLSPQERKDRSLLLVERRSLLDSGKTNIKIRENRLFIGRRFHARVEDGVLIRGSSIGDHSSALQSLAGQMPLHQGSSSGELLRQEVAVDINESNSSNTGGSSDELFQEVAADESDSSNTGGTDSSQQ